MTAPTAFRCERLCNHDTPAAAAALALASGAWREARGRQGSDLRRKREGVATTPSPGPRTCEAPSRLPGTGLGRGVLPLPEMDGERPILVVGGLVFPGDMGADRHVVPALALGAVLGLLVRPNDDDVLAGGAGGKVEGLGGLVDAADIALVAMKAVALVLPACRVGAGVPAHQYRRNPERRPVPGQPEGCRCGRTIGSLPVCAAVVWFRSAQRRACSGAGAGSRRGDG